MFLQYKYFENTVGKGEIASNEQFHPFPTEFSALYEKSLPFSLNLKRSFANSFKFVIWERVILVLNYIHNLILWLQSKKFQAISLSYQVLKYF